MNRSGGEIACRFIRARRWWQSRATAAVAATHDGDPDDHHDAHPLDPARRSRDRFRRHCARARAGPCDDDLVRVIVDAADVILRGGAPHYRHGGYDDRLIVERDRYGRPVYYRHVPRNAHVVHYRGRHPVHGIPPGHRNNVRHAPSRNVRCDSGGRCTAQYYDPRYDRKTRGRRW